MKKILLACLVAIAAQGLCQTLPFSVSIPPAPGSNTVEANNSILISPTYQTTPGGTYIFRVVPKRYANSPTNAQNDYNFIRVEEAYVELLNTTAFNNADVDQKNVTYQYFDGLGRPMQTIQVKGSPQFKDMIVPIQYDQHGRQPREYLPYTLANDGRYQTTAVAAQSSFYNPASLYNNKIKTDGAPYAQTIFEKSPLNRVSEKGAPGTVWQPDLITPANGKTIKASYFANVDGTGSGQEKIKIWTLTSVTLNGKPEFIIGENGAYPSNTLSVSVAKDEDNRIVRTYVDKQGKTILKKLQYVTSPAINNDNDWTLTYYIYDEFQMLRFVLQPKFIARNSVYNGLATQQLKKDMLDSLTFEYRYDEKGQMIYKRVPGAKQTELVYDKWNRLVLSQDGNQRVAGKWSFIKYDVYNRPIITGEIASANTTSQMVTAVAAINPRFETNASGNSVGYTLNQTYPTTVTLNDIYVITYYDNYAFKTNLVLGTAYDASIPSGFTGTVNTNVKTLVTGSKIRVLDSSPAQWLVSASYYDAYYRVLQVVGDDHLGNKNRTTNEYYGITTRVTKSQLTHGSALTSLMETEYDHRGRLKKIWQTMDNVPANKTLLASHSYNEIGQLVEKNVHSTNSGASFLQSNDYRYNIRGWLSSINNSALTNDGTTNDDTNDLFGMELKYNDVVSLNGTNTTAQFNGNISAVQWKSNNLVDTSLEKIYGYKYDNINRVTDATYASKNGSTWTGNVNLYDEILTYDKNGNIRSLKRKSLHNSTTLALVDDMVYYYKGNQLDAISDNATATNKPYGFSEIMQGVTTGEYTYDANGNLEVDQNKGLVGPSVPDPKGVLYNYLNLPKEVRLGQKRIVYTYNAVGIKLRKIAYDQSGVEISRTNYVGGIQYEGTTPQLKFIATAEGRAVKDGTSWNYEYFHKDHLGNARVVYGYQKQVDEYRATLETPTPILTKEQSQFYNLAATRVTGFNHTTASQDVVTPNSSAETNGFLSGKAVGPAKMLQVSSGDRVQMEVFARYTTATAGNNTIITNLASAVTGAYGLINAGESATAFQALNNNLPAAAGAVNRTSGVAKAYLFYILFDNNYVYQQFGYQAITTAASVAHERLYLDVAMPSSGYVYIYVANESNVSTATSVYFDDMSIIHQRTTSALQVVQTTDYYPFGLAINPTSYQKQTSLDNDYLYNGKELQDEHNLGWMDYGARMYMADVGRWGVVDPLSEKSRRWTPYAYALDNPIRYIDPDGMEATGYSGYKENSDQSVNVHEMSDMEKFEYAKSVARQNFEGNKSKQKIASSMRPSEHDVSDGSKEHAGPAGNDDTEPEDTQPELVQDRYHTDIEVLHASSRIDIYRETTSYKTDEAYVTHINTVFVGYDKDGVLKQINGYKVVTKEVQIEDERFKTTSPWMKVEISKNMKTLIYEVANSAYHCFGCYTEPSVIEKYIKFIFSPKPQPPKNRLKVGPPEY